MAITSKNVYNINQTSSTNFVFLLQGFPNLNFTIQSANLPGIFGRMIEMPTPVGNWNAQYDKIDYETLVVEFLVDESLNNWREIYNWQRALAPTNLYSGNNQYRLWKAAGKPFVSPATLYILTNSNNICIQVDFKNAFPISITGLDFTTTAKEDQKLYAKVQFAYDYFDLTVNTEFNLEAVPENKISSN